MIYALVFRVGQFSMVWDFIGRRPLTVRDLAVSLKDGPWLLNHISKVWRLLFWRIYINKDSEFKPVFSV